jgi:hypothetical protein
MRGRWQALAVAVLGAGSLLFGWISAAAIALVTLRQGVASGGWLVFWALLPAVVASWLSGDPGSVLLLLGVFVLAVVLRATVSLALAVAASALVGLISGGGLLLIGADFLAQLVEVFAALLEQLQSNVATEESMALVLSAPSTGQVAGILAAGNAVTAVLSLLLARYWQALLYNPGGFREEFHALRLPPLWTTGLGLLSLAVWAQEPWVSGWALVVSVPLMFCGFSLVHAYVAASGRGASSLVVFYLLWLFVDPVKGLLLGCVVADAWIDFRRRWVRPPAN